MGANKHHLTATEKKEVISLTKDLIKIPSSVKDGNDIYEYVRGYLTRKGFNVRLQTIDNPHIKYYDFSNLYLKIGNGKGPKIMLNGHLDAVGVHEKNKWCHPPFSAIEEEGKIYGRGAADMKAGCAAAIIAFIALAKRKKEINGELFLSCVFGEEAPFSLGTDTLLQEYDLKNYDLVIIPEPSPLLTKNDYCFTHGRIHQSHFPTPIIGAEGRVLLEIEFFGKAAHASHPSVGVNALHDAATLISELARFDIFTHIKRGRGHYVVLNIEGGDESFTVPDYCKILVNRQVMLGENAKTVIREIKKIVKALGLKSKVHICKRYSPGPELEYKPFLTESSTYLDRFIKSIIEYDEKDQENKEKRICKFSTRSIGDFNLFGARAKVSTVIFGPGGGNIHAPNEFVNKDETIKTADYLLNFLMEVYS
ncbi:MAG: M20/M25/M40 family metallo-hydrolase [Candidatus Thermoplasmatota archaeon]|nr:M20/M25/M40 family metallo-hydrolase [Candidatus Thermoplasmatota archaeon]